MPKEEVPRFCPKNRGEWREWLSKNHLSQKSIWLVYYKAKSKKHNLSWEDAVEEALCYGWIDSLKKSIDEESFMQFFSPRKAKSNWSKINKAKIKELQESGLMTDAGMASVNIAKENGFWTYLDPVEDLIVPKDLEDAFQNHPGSKSFYDSQSNSVKKMFLYWILSAKKTETRQKRILEIVENASNKLKPKAFR
tara:strand:- start:1369 stop:1950 length:582 start_codon:yes stop_codon:yes gene_type:complete